MKRSALAVALIVIALLVSCQSPSPTVCTDSSGNPIDINQSNSSSISPSLQDDQTIGEKGLPMVVKLGRDNCIPCIEMNKILDEVKAMVGDKAIISIIDVSKEPDKAQLFGIKLIPTEIFYDSNFKEIFRIEGVIQKDDVLFWLKKGGADL